MAKAGPPPHREHSFWLIPKEPLRTKLRSIIRELAAPYDAVDFEPHLTISSGPSNDAETIAIAQYLAEQFSPVELDFRKLDQTDVFTKTLFVQFEESATARRMSETVRHRSAQNPGYRLNPHLSLLYKTMPEAARLELCRTLDVPTGRYLFDRLRVIETEVPLTQIEQIRKWRTVFETSLKQ